MLTNGFYILFRYNQLESLIIIISGFVTIILFLTYLLDSLHNRIVCEEEKMIVTGHIFQIHGKIQFPDEIRYNAIKDVAIICANTNSLKKRENSVFSSLRPIIYFEILLKNDDTKWIYIECFSKKQRKHILNIINDKTNLSLSYETLEKKDYSIYKKKKQK